MNKYIDRAALFNSLSNAKTVEEIFAAIQAAPAEDVEPVRRGRWIHKSEVYSYCGHLFYPKICSVCNSVFEYTTNYCPNCGARMEG